MTILYNCHTDGGDYRITKFDSLGNVESTYLCSLDNCECPAGHRPTCRHRLMLPRFLAKGAVNSFYFYDYDRQGWVTNEPAIANDPMFKPAEPTQMSGFNKEMQAALEADGEKLKALTGEDHGPKFLSEPVYPSEPTIRRRI